MRQFVGVVLIRSDGSILAQHRDNKPDILGSDTWCVVGGAREKDDISLAIAAARELREETGYMVDPERLEVLVRDEYTTERGVPVERVIFLGEYDDQQSIECHEGQEIRFISLPELDSLTFYNGHEGFLRAASKKATSGGIERR